MIKLETSVIPFTCMSCKEGVGFKMITIDDLKEIK